MLSPPTILVACEQVLDRLRIEAALLPLRADVRHASSVAEAIEALGSTPRTNVAACISDLQLAGGGALGLARALGGIPVVARTSSPPYGSAGSDHREGGVVGYLDPLATASEVRVRFAWVAALDPREGRGGRFSVPVADLSAADVIAWVSAQRWSAVARFHSEPGGPARFALRFREGALWSADGPDLAGERALAAVLNVQDGLATVTRDDSGGAAATIRAPRNIHRAPEDALQEALAVSNRARQRLTTLPGLDVTYRIDKQRAERVIGAREVTQRLIQVMDGRQTLRQGIAAAGIIEPLDLERVAELRRVGAFEPTTGAFIPEPDPPRVELLTGARALTAELERSIGPTNEMPRSGARRRPQPTDEYVSLEDLEARRRRTNLRLLGAALFLLAVTIAAVVWSTQGDDERVRVHVIGDP